MLLLWLFRSLFSLSLSHSLLLSFSLPNSLSKNLRQFHSLGASAYLASTLSNSLSILLSLLFLVLARALTLTFLDDFHLFYHNLDHFPVAIVHRSLGWKSISNVCVRKGSMWSKYIQSSHSVALFSRAFSSFPCYIVQRVRAACV